MQRLSRRTTLRGAKILAVAGAVTLLSLWIILFTSLGTRLGLILLRSRLGPAVTIDAMSGTLRSPLEILGVRYQGEQAFALIDTVRINWRLSRLLTRKLDFESLEVVNVTVDLRAPATTDPGRGSPAESAPPVVSDFKLPVNLQLPRAVVYHIAINRSEDSTLAVFDSLTVSVFTRGDSVTVDHMAISGPDVGASLGGAVRTSGAYPMSFEYDWNLVARGVRGAGSGHVSGDLAHLELWHETSEPVVSELSAEIDSALTAQTFTTSIAIADFNIRVLDSTKTDAVVGGELRAAGALAAFTSTAELRVTHASVGLATPRLSISRNGEAVYVDSMEVSFRDSPATLTGSGTLTIAEGKQTFTGELGWQQLGWPFLELPQVTSAGQLRAVGSMDEYALEAEMTFAGERLVPGSMVVAGRGTRDSLVVSGQGEGFGGRFLLDGATQLRPLIGWVATMDVDSIDLAALLPDTVSWVSDLSLAVRTEGTKSDSALLGSIQITRLSAALKGEPFTASAGARLVNNSLQIDSAHATFLAGDVWAEGSFSWEPRIQWQLFSRAADINPAPLMPDSAEWAGSISAVATIAGSHSANGLEARVQIDTVSGELRGENLSATGAAAVVDSTYRLDSLTLGWGTMNLIASGELGEFVSGQVNIYAPDLSLAVPDAGGSLLADVSIGGPRSVPQIGGTFEATNLSYLDYALERITGAGGFDFAGNGSFDFVLDGDDLILPTRTIDTLGLTVTGVREDHRVAAFVSEGRSSMTFGAVGGLNAATWMGSLEAFEISDSVAGTWRLREAERLIVGKDSAVVAEPFCLVSEDASICSAGRWSNGGTWDLTARASAIPLERLAALYPQSFQIEGTLEADAAFSTTVSGELGGSVRLTTDRGQIRYSISGDQQTLVHDSGTVEITVGPEGVFSSMGVVLENVGPNAPTFAEVAGRFHLPAFRPLSDSLLPRRIDGGLMMTISDLSALEAVYPQVVSIDGSIAADLTIGGTVREPFFVGEAMLRDGSADIPSLGLELRNAEWTAVGQGAEGITLAGSVESGTGRMDMTGLMKASAEGDSILQLHLVGERLLAVNTPEVQLLASPDLTVSVGKREVSLEGDVIIPRATIDLPEIPAIAVRASRDAVFVSDSTHEDVPSINTRARLRVLLGDSVSFRGFGFAGRPSGNLLITDTPGQATIATGQLTIEEGRYRAYGQDLTVETGRAIYAGGPVDNPGLDVRATRRARDDDVVAGLEVKGTLKAPEITVFSEPPMLQSEALAYLVLGRPLAELTSSEGNRVTNAAMSLGLRGGNLLAQRVARRFGLDDAGIEAEGSWEQASLYAGKYLSPKLYVSYGYGLFEAASLFSARYMLTRRWTLQAETGEHTSTDIKYRIERGR